MRDHTYNGVPVSKMRREDIERMIADGEVQINEGDGRSEEELQEAIQLRLRIELHIRDLRLRSRLR